MPFVDVGGMVEGGLGGEGVRERRGIGLETGVREGVMVLGGCW